MSRTVDVECLEALLHDLERLGEATPRELIGTGRGSRGTVYSRLHYLRRKGLVSRREDRVVARHLYRLTEHGREAVEAGAVRELLRPLTKRQAEVLAFIQLYWADKGFSPTIREIGEALGIESTNAVVDHLRAIEKKGYIKRRGGYARSIVVLRTAA